MLRLALLVLVTACSIPGDRFFKPGEGSSDGGTDGNSDASRDAPPSLALRRGYIVDTQAGIFLIHKDPTTGQLMRDPAAPTGTASAQGAIANAQGTRLFSFDSQPAAVRDWTIMADGTLASAGGMPITGCTGPRFAAMHPTGKYVVIGCSNNAFVVLTLTATGAAAATSVVTTTATNMLNPVFTPNGNCLYITDLNGPAVQRIMIFSFDANTGATTYLAGAGGPSLPRGIAVHPNGSYAYMAGSGGVQQYVVASNCGLGMMGGSLAIGPNSGNVTVDPTGKFLFVTGTEVYAFRIGTDGVLAPVPGNPFIATGTTMDGATMDPAVPNILYITGRGYGGTFPAMIAADGSVSMGQTVMTGSGGSYWFALAP